MTTLIAYDTFLHNGSRDHLRLEMSIYNAKFTTGQTALAAGVSNDTLQNWIKRGVVVGHREAAPIEGGGSPGKYRSFSFYNVVEIAIAKAVIDLGMNLELAFRAAAHFAHFAEGNRYPSLPFPDHYTLLCISRDNVAVINWWPGHDIVPELRHHGAGVAHMVIEVNDIFDRVCASLGEHPEAVMEAAYKR